jgi:bifunctional DNA-binding transcriptional regulator/antitoxin component of YhaV-PrlF toxin-antitoxin module
MIVIPRPILIALGWVPGEAMEVTIELRGNRLFLAKKPAAGEAKLARFKARLTERINSSGSS